MAPGSGKIAGQSANNSPMPAEEEQNCSHERSEMVAGNTLRLPVDGQCSYDMTIAVGNGIFKRKVQTPIPEQNLDATVQIKQNGVPPQSSSGYATGATPASAGFPATSQLPSSDIPPPGAASLDLSSGMNVIHGKLPSSDPDSIQVNPPAILSSEDLEATLAEEIDSPQQPRNQHHPPPTGEPPPGYKYPKEETGVSTMTTDTADNITVAVTYKEDTPPPFDGLAPKAFNHNDEDDPLRSSDSILSVFDVWQTQSTSSQLPMSFTALSSPPPTPTSHKCRFFDDEVSADSGFGSMPSTDMNLL